MVTGYQTPKTQLPVVSKEHKTKLFLTQHCTNRLSIRLRPDTHLL